MSVLIGALLAAGLALVSPRPAERLQLVLAAGAAALLWRLLWLAGINIVMIKVPSGLAYGPATEGLLTLSAAGAAMLLTALIITLTLIVFGAVRPTAGSILFVPAWTVGLILPGLGRSGSWPATSVMLAVVALFLSLFLGLLVAAIAPLSRRRAP